MSTRWSSVTLSIVIAAYTAWGAFYVYRMSFSFEGPRIFCLWDDGMISMTYARNLAEGHGLVWNPGEAPVQGYTNLGVTLVMAALHLLPLAGSGVSLAFQLLNLAMLVAILALSWRAARRGLGAEPWAGVAAVLAVALCAPLGVWSLQGADTGFVAVWLLWAMLALVASDPARGPATRFWAIAPGILIRSDAFVFYMALLATSLAWPGDRRRRLLHGGAALVLVLGGSLLFSQLYYGDALPNTYYLKTTGMPRHLMLGRGVMQLGYWLPGLFALALAGFAASRDRQNRFAQQVVAVVAIGIAYHVWVGGDWARLTGGRHLVAVLPPLLVLATLGGQALLARIRSRAIGGGGRDGLLLATAAATALLLNPTAMNREWFDVRLPTMFRYYNVKNYRFAAYLRDFTDPATSVAVHWGGVIPYFSRRSAIDVLGKSDRHIARLKVEEFKPGHSKYDWDYVIRQRRPDILDALSRGLESRDDLLRDYHLIQTRQRNFAGLSFYLRRESAAKLIDADAVVSDAPIRDASAAAPD